MLLVQKVQLDAKDVDSINEICQAFNYKSKSEYMRLAIIEKIKSDRKKLRELVRKKAMEMYGREQVEDLFESISGEDFENR